MYQRALLFTLNHRLATFLHGFAKVYEQWQHLLTFLVNITILMRYTQKALKFLIKILCYCSFLQNTLISCTVTTLCSVLLHLVLVKSELDKAVITHFYLWFLDSFSSGSVIIWQVNMKLLRPNIWWCAYWTRGSPSAHFNRSMSIFILVSIHSTCKQSLLQLHR